MVMTSLRVSLFTRIRERRNEDFELYFLFRLSSNPNLSPISWETSTDTRQSPNPRLHGMWLAFTCSTEINLKYESILYRRFEYIAIRISSDWISSLSNGIPFASNVKYVSCFNSECKMWAASNIYFIYFLLFVSENSYRWWKYQTDFQDRLTNEKTSSLL